MNLIFFGIIGSGKGTQAELISNKFRIPIISTGNIFRRNIKNKTKLGIQIEHILAKGHLVDDEITVKVLKKELKKMDLKRGVIIDGFPRTLHQAKMLEHIMPIDHVFNISLSEQEVLSRITNRRTCKCGATYHIKYNPPKKEGLCDKCGRKLFVRDDSKPSSVKNRIRVYKNKTEKLIEYYKEKKMLISINGNLSIKEVFKQISDKITELKKK
jgi:adenylate kinase